MLLQSKTRVGVIELERERGTEATKVLFCLMGTRVLLHERWRKEGKKEGREIQGGGRGGNEGESPIED